MTKINLNSLKDSDYKALLDNDKVWDKLIEFTSEEASLRISDWLDDLAGMRDYSLSDSSNYNYISIINSYNFLTSVLDVQNDYCLLTETMTETVKKLLSDYENSGLDSFYENKLDKLGEQVADELVRCAANEYDWALNNTSLLEAMKEYDALADIYGGDAYYNREDNKIYYTCAD